MKYPQIILWVCLLSVLAWAGGTIAGTEYGQRPGLNQAEVDARIETLVNTALVATALQPNVANQDLTNVGNITHENGENYQYGNGVLTSAGGTTTGATESVIRQFADTHLSKPGHIEIYAGSSGTGTMFRAWNVVGSLSVNGTPVGGGGGTVLNAVDISATTNYNPDTAKVKIYMSADQDDVTRVITATVALDLVETDTRSLVNTNTYRVDIPAELFGHWDWNANLWMEEMDDTKAVIVWIQHVGPGFTNDIASGVSISPDVNRDVHVSLSGSTNIQVVSSVLLSVWHSNAASDADVSSTIGRTFLIGEYRGNR